MDFSDQLRAAEGYFELGMHDQAWANLESLPPIDQIIPEAVALKLQICTARKHWDRGTGLASVLSAALLPEHRLIAARFHHAYARELCWQDMVILAREQVCLAVKVSKEIRMEILEDRDLEPIWR